MFIAWSCVSLVILNDHYPGKLIGHGGPVPQPPRSPDLTPVELLLWDLVRYAVGLFPISNNIEHYPGKLIGRGGPIPQPPRSPDLIPPPPPSPELSLWDFVSDVVCLSPMPYSTEDLKFRIAQAVQKVDDMDRSGQPLGHVLLRKDH